MLKIGEAAEALGVSKSTLRDWTQKGIIHATVTPTGHRLYSEKDVEMCINMRNGGETSTDIYKGVYEYCVKVGTALENGDVELCSLYAQQVSLLVDKLGMSDKETMIVMLGKDNVERFRCVALPLTDKDKEYFTELASSAYRDFLKKQFEW